MDQFRPRDDQGPVREIEKGIEDLKAMLARFARGPVLWLTLLLLVAFYFASGIYIVSPAEKGVELLFGRVYSVTEPGLRYRLPKPFMSATLVPVRTVQRIEVGFRSERGVSQSRPQEALMLTGDENILDVQLMVQYRIEDPVKYLFGAYQPDSVIRASAEVALRGVVGENTIDYTMTTGRLEVQKKVETYLQRLLETYDTGLRVIECNLLGVDAPGQVREAFHDVVRAWEDRERLIKEAEGFREDILPKARGQAKQEIQEAEAYKAERVIRSKGDAQRFKAVLAEYLKAPTVTRERLYLESAERFLPATRVFVMDAKDSGVVPFLPLLQKSATSPVKEEPKPAVPSPPNSLPKKGK